MKTTIVLAVLTLLIPVAASAQDGKLNLSSLDRLAERASEKQEVTIDESMLKSVTPGLVRPGPKADAAKQVLSGLKGVYVRNYEFEKDKAYSMDDIAAIRKQLSSAGWMKIVSNEEKGKGPNDWELQEIYLFKQQDGKPGGLVILNAEPGELSVVNIVGTINLADLDGLGGILGIPHNVGNSLGK
ncbi:MAG TPA: DUF4252 domain-containing protein [Vicinamibacterales bacterium]|jgi:hypothetical protein|nr:DUF4252 domain-containing protein [Vicinamibacterales bacterium]